MISSLEQWLALTPSVASLQALTSRSSVRFRGVAPHHQSPTSAMQPAGQDLGAPLAPEINGQYRSYQRRVSTHHIDRPVIHDLPGPLETTFEEEPPIGGGFARTISWP